IFPRGDAVRGVVCFRGVLAPPAGAWKGRPRLECRARLRRGADRVVERRIAVFRSGDDVIRLFFFSFVHVLVCTGVLGIFFRFYSPRNGLSCGSGCLKYPFPVPRVEVKFHK
ncbi:unnamed protein product, partial [Scytosiphon promiscuus]